MGDREAVGLLVIVCVGCGGGKHDLPDARRLADARIVDAPVVSDAPVADAFVPVPDASPADAFVPVPDAVPIDAFVPIADAAIPDAPIVIPDAVVPIPDASPPDAMVCSPALAPTSDGSSTQLRALVISEINPGDYIELWNNTSSPISLGTSNYQLCSPFTYVALSAPGIGAGVTVPSHGYATIGWPPGFTDNNSGGEVILYLDSFTGFGDSTKIMDFTCWGTNPHGSRISQAGAIGKWQSGTTCGVPALTGNALHRVIGSDGVNPADYDTSAPPSPMNCTP